jgi:hypothetical protein
MKLTPMEAQQDQMRHAYYDGAPGILVSGLIWLSAAGVCYWLGLTKAVWTLLIGGALIHPISVLITKAIGRPAKVDQANAFNQLAAASTIWLIVCCAMAYGLFLLKMDLFFPALMASIGSRYLIFGSVFGRPIFWVLGASLIVAANVCLFTALAPVFAAGIGGAIEVLFAFLVFSTALRPK